MSDFPLPPLLTPQQAREKSIREAFERIQASAPPWAGKAPWLVEAMIENAARRTKQQELFEGGSDEK